MRIVVIGTGHVGLVTAATLSSLGHQVVGFDDDADKIATLQKGHSPFFEEGLQDLLEAETAAGRLSFADDAAHAIPDREVAFICVGTPGRPTGEPNLLAVERAATAVGRWASQDMVVVQKSTVPVQTSERVGALLRRLSRYRLHVASNPEFLREGCAVADSLHPDRILVGAETEEAHTVLRRVYAPMIEAGARYFATDIATAELAKHACNAFLSLKISYANALARVCEAAGADVTAIADIMGADPRIGRAFLNAGLGYGGFCFPKDIAAFHAQAQRLGYDFRLLEEVVRINDEALEAVVGKVSDALWNLEQKRVVVLGLAFKPGTDDLRDSPALRLVRKLVAGGASVVGCDPQAAAEAHAEVPGLEIADDVYQAAEGADALVLATEWPEFAQLDWVRLKGLMTNPLVIDGRNLYDPATLQEAGFTYLPTGRPAVNWPA